MRKKIIILISIICLLTSGIFASAYFIKKLTGNTHSIAPDLDDDSIIEVANYEALVHYGSVYETNQDFNSDVKYSDASTRKTLLLTNDITFKNDVLINRDCHINLNKKTIDLNGFDLNIKNHYEGVFSLYNGTIIDSSTGGKVIIDCPYAMFDFTDLTYNESIMDINVDDQQVCEAAFDLIYANIANAGINDFYDSKLSEVRESHCVFCNDDTKYCIYTYTDLDLLFNYFTYDLSIEYTSNSEALVNTGKIVNTGTESINANLQD